MNLPGFIAGAIAWGRGERRARIRRGVRRHKKEARAKQKRITLTSKQDLWDYWRNIAKGKWNTTRIRQFTLKSGVFGREPSKKELEERAKKKAYEEFRSQFTRKQWNQMRLDEIRKSLKARGLNEFGHPIHG